jgi:hypothetical protein
MDRGTRGVQRPISQEPDVKISASSSWAHAAGYTVSGSEPRFKLATRKYSAPLPRAGHLA